MNASSIRGDNLLQSYDKDVPPDCQLYGFHRKCYQSYMHKTTLNQFLSKRQVEVRSSSRQSGGKIYH